MPQAIVWSSVPCYAHQTPPSNKYNITSILSRLKMSCSLESFCMMCASFEFHRSQSPQVSHIHVSYCLSQHNTHNIIKSTMSPNGARANWLWFILFRGFETISICTCDKYITEQTNFIRIARFSLPLIPFLWLYPLRNVLYYVRWECKSISMLFAQHVFTFCPPVRVWHTRTQNHFEMNS